MFYSLQKWHQQQQLFYDPFFQDTLSEPVAENISGFLMAPDWLL